MEFITTDGKLFIDGNMLSQKRLSNTHRRNLYLFAFFFLYFINLFVEKIESALETGKIFKWVSVFIFGAILLLFVALLIDFIFKLSWKKSIDISTIDKIETIQSEEGLETSVELTLRSKRYKKYNFRTLEKQVDSFIHTLRSINPNSILVNG
ncbi:MAG: hypothetical protein ABUT20_23910 [Bacteroidota bacterium]